MAIGGVCGPADSARGSAHGTQGLADASASTKKVAAAAQGTIGEGSASQSAVRIDPSQGVVNKLSSHPIVSASLAGITVAAAALVPEILKGNCTIS